jgi:hypothetical protein
MAYTNEWSDASPTGDTPAKQIDDEFRKLRVDIRERMNTLVTDFTADPIELKAESGGAVTDKTMLVPSWAFKSDNDLTHTSTGVSVGVDSDLYAPVILPIGATVKAFQAMVIPGLGTMTVRLGYIDHGLAAPTFITVDSNTSVGSSSIKLISNSDSELAHVVATDRHYLLWITTDSSTIAPSKIFGVKITYDIDNVSQTI